MIIKKITYLGDDPEIISSGQAFYEKRSTPALQFEFTHTKGIQIDSSLIILDFTDPAINFETILRQVDLLKHHDVHRGIVIAGLFTNKEEMEKNIHFLHFGLSYTFIKGNDISIFFEDTFYVTFDVNPGFPLFARAKDLDLKYQGAIPSLLVAMNETTVKINSDIELENLLPVKHSLLGDKKIHHFPIEEINPSQETGDSLLTFSASIPYPGPWEQISSDAILQDTVETLLAQEERFTAMKENCLVFDSKGDLFQELLSTNIKLPLQLHFKSKEPEKIFKRLKPEVIILVNNDVEDSDALAIEIISAVKEQKMYEPMVIVFNSSRDSAGMRSLLQYKHLLAHNSKCDINILSQLLLLHSRKTELIPTDWKTLKPGDNLSKVDILLDLFITGISEHAISFTSTVEIPMYTNLRFDVPVDCFLLVVPTLRNLPPNARGEHYMGFIHGIDQEEANYLRKFVNQIIFSPLTTFKRIEIKKSDETGEMVLPENVEEETKEEPKREPSITVLTRRTFAKSKL